jgi:hypothetical protein
MRANHADHPFGELYCWDCGELLKPTPRRKKPRRCKRHQEKLNRIYLKRGYGKPE